MPQAAVVAAVRPPKFVKDGGFRRDLDARVDAYFEQTHLQRRDLPAMYWKSAVIFAWFGSTWALMVFAGFPWYINVLLAVAHGLAVSTIGMSVMHDANHSGYSRHPWVNRFFGHSLDILGCSSYVWKMKHNTIHHTWTNVVGFDDDLEVGALARMAPQQPRYPWHRAQHWYIWGLYALLLPKWYLIDDWYNLANARVGRTHMPAPPPSEMAALVGGKVIFAAWSLVIPMIFHPVLPVLGLWMIASCTLGVVLATTFQLAHCVEDVEFSAFDEPLKRDWAEHQLATTVDFAMENPLVTWLTGGLNFQVVHHLYPKVCHLHYPAIARLVSQTAAEHKLKYREHPKLTGAIAAHYRWMRGLGQPVATTLA